ncbi:hypothetical protein Tco_0505105 [Tanacetum coccineum]
MPIISYLLPSYGYLVHGGTMTISLMHQWHDTICDGVIGPRRSFLEHMDASKLSNRMRTFLAACPPVSLSPPVTDLIVTTCDFQKDLLDWNISPVNDGFDAKALFNMYITKRINDKSLELLESCMLYKIFQYLESSFEMRLKRRMHKLAQTMHNI